MCAAALAEVWSLVYIISIQARIKVKCFCNQYIDTNKSLKFSVGTQYINKNKSVHFGLYIKHIDKMSMVNISSIQTRIKV